MFTFKTIIHSKNTHASMQTNIQIYCILEGMGNFRII